MNYPPTIMFHSVGLQGVKWSFAHIGESFECFREKMSALHRARYRSLFFGEKSASNERTVCLTFDDGYLDNWLYVYPIIRELGLSITVFVTTDFIDPSSDIRTLPKHSDSENTSHAAGFLSVPEMLKMQESGFVSIQSHACTHTWFPCGPKVVDYWHPGIATSFNGPVWMLWNRWPKCKPFYISEAQDNESQIPWGTPVYEHAKSLESPRYFPEETDLHEELTRFVEREGGGDYFQHSDWRSRLDDIVAQRRNRYSGPVGRYESNDEYLDRARQELADSKNILESKLGSKIDSLCWPGGGLTREIIDMARQIGYRHFTRPSAWSRDAPSFAGNDMVPRISSLANLSWRGRNLGKASAREFIWHIEKDRGSKVACTARRAAILLRYAKSFIGKA